MDSENIKYTSGRNESEIIKIETALYNKTNIEKVTDDCVPTSPRISTWKIVNDHPKFNVDLNPKNIQANVTNNKSDSTENDTGEYSNEGTDNQEFKRPIGRKYGSS